MSSRRRTTGGFLRWGAILAAGAVFIGGGATAAHAAVTDPPTIVSLTFDDGNADQSAATAILDAAGLKGTFFITTGWIDSPTYLTRAQLSAMKAAGHEIAGHTVSHPDLATLSAAEYTKQICQGRNTLADWGFPTTDFAYPFASVTPALEAAVSACGFNSARNLGDTFTRFGGTAGLFAETIPPANAFQTRAPDEVDATWTLADLQKTVTDAETSGGGWVQLTFHHICTNAALVCDPLNLTNDPAIFQQFVDWLKVRKATDPGSTTNTTVKTVQQVIGGAVKPLVASTNAFRAAPAAGENGVLNPSLETASSIVTTPAQPPQCWQAGGFGASTATFTTLTTAAEAHTGTKAEQLVVTGLVSGDAKLALMQDLGTCAPTATPGHTYSLRTWYKSTVTTQFDVYYRNAVGGWIYWSSSPLFSSSAAYTQASWTTPPVPAGSTGISFGLNLTTNGTLVTDDYALYDSVGAPPPSVSTRLAGADRLATAVQISQAYAPGVARVYLANGYNFPDALSAAPAAAHFQSPVLLTPPDRLVPGVAAEITRLAPTLIVAVGGTNVVSDAVLAQAQAARPTATVIRIAGPDRYATSRAIALDAFGSGATSAYLASGANFPDALAAGPAAAHFGGPTILVPGASATLDTATANLLATLKVTTVRIAGDANSVTAGIENSVKVVPGVTTVKRNSGADRYATAVAINFDAFATSSTAYLAVGTSFPDAMAGAALAGLKNAPLYLSPTTCLGAGVSTEMQRLGATSLVLFGGTAVLSDNVYNLVGCV
ncbi:cell wall-binding repeat-containing protein [Cryobacterium breve]|uniref:Cell wall-binding repeat-containing protein n=1 Tax=Cryobacterium breve TaxID=1259258 RepID=A0ABY7NEM5_9MICO|nr:cell wall-binding repeat-containing protein [Cryobacterium breve]WBM78988.1 cell wall-binding repeat-containing protein [Cryobacterium breve]